MEEFLNFLLNIAIDKNKQAIVVNVYLLTFLFSFLFCFIPYAIFYNIINNFVPMLINFFDMSRWNLKHHFYLSLILALIFTFNYASEVVYIISNVQYN